MDLISDLVLNSKRRKFVNEVIDSLCDKYNYKYIDNQLYKNNLFENIDDIIKIYHDGIVEVFGSKDVMIDAEVISLVYNIYSLLGLDVEIGLNTLEIDNKDFEKLKEYLDLLDIEYKIDKNLKLDDYNSVFEIFLKGTNVSLGVGGRNDAQTSLVRFAIDIDKTIYEMINSEINFKLNNSLDVCVIYDNEEEKDTSCFICQELRMNGFIVESDYLNSSTKSVDRDNSKYIVILNSKYLKNYEVNVKDNKTKEEEIVNINDLVDYLDIHL